MFDYVVNTTDLLVVDADAHVAAKLPVINTLEFKYLPRMFFTTDERARQYGVRRPLIDIFATKDGVSFVKFVVQL